MKQEAELYFTLKFFNLVKIGMMTIEEFLTNRQFYVENLGTIYPENDVCNWIKSLQQ